MVFETETFGWAALSIILWGRGGGGGGGGKQALTKYMYILCVI